MIDIRVSTLDRGHSVNVPSPNCGLYSTLYLTSLLYVFALMKVGILPPRCFSIYRYLFSCLSSAAECFSRPASAAPRSFSSFVVSPVGRSANTTKSDDFEPKCRCLSFRFSQRSEYISIGSNVVWIQLIIVVAPRLWRSCIKKKSEVVGAWLGSLFCAHW